MRFEPPLIQGTLVERYKRFLADVELPEEGEVTAHCPNSGSMKDCLNYGETCWVQPADKPSRKLKWTLELTSAEYDPSVTVNIDTSTPNELAEEAFEAGLIPEFEEYEALRREFSVGDSRIDLLLGPKGIGEPDFELDDVNSGEVFFCEVKNVTLTDGEGTALFPDAVTERGQKHLRELTGLKDKGFRTANLYTVNREDAVDFSTADHIDPDYGELFREARGAGVEMLVWRADITPREVELAQELAVREE